MRTRRRLWVAVGLVVAAGIAAGLAWFQPWKLFVDHRVDEALPSVATQSAAPTTPPAAVERTSPAAQETPAPPPRDVLLARGRLITHEHDTSGTVSLVRRADGSRVLAIADLDTSDGPDVHVWLTDAPVIPGEDGWYVFDDGKHVSLGTLKGNLGNQVYAVPASADLDKLTSVSLWCDRFDVSFGAAELRPV